MNDNSQEESKKRLSVQQAGKLDEEKDKEHHLNIELLCETAMQFVEFSHDKDIYKYIGEKLREFAGEGSYIIINSIDSKKNILTTRSFIGGRKFLLKIVKIIGQDPVGMTYDSTDAALEYLTDGKLHLYEEGIYGIALRNIPANICKAIEKLASIEKIFTIGLIKENKLFGTVAIFLQDGSKVLKNKDIIEMFIKQASLAVQRRQAEEALKESEEKYHFIYENAMVGIGISNSTGSILAANETMCRIIGYTSEELSKVRLAETFVNPENRKEILSKLKKEGKVENYEVPLYNKNKEIYWANFSTKPIRFKNQEAILTTVIDITERKQAEENLILEKEFSEKIINTSNAIIVGLNINHEIQLFNEGAEKITGYKRKNVLGKDWFQLFFPPEMIDEMNKVWKDSWGIKAHSYTNPILIKNGDQRIISWQSTGMYEGENRKNHLLISIGEDITERRNAEEEIQKYQVHLEDLIKERTKDLEDKNNELERFNKLFIGREFRIKELRNKVKELEKAIGNRQ